MNKRIVLRFCKQLLADRQKSIEESLAQLNEAVANEQKSTAGDKHDTARAMLHLEQEKLSKQLRLIQEEIARLNRISPDAVTESVQIGSLVQTENACFFIGPSLGKTQINNQELFAVSGKAPIAQAMLGKRVGDTFNFNGASQVITSIS